MQLSIFCSLFIFRRHHAIDIAFCDCESIAVTLVRYQLWPASSCEPRLAFHMELMELLRSLMMKNQVSITGFYRALQANYLDLSRIGDVGFCLYLYQ